jgi:hypothetical protein
MIVFIFGKAKTLWDLENATLLCGTITNLQRIAKIQYIQVILKILAWNFVW